MRVNGRDVKFLRTVSATCKIAELCPDGDITNAGRLFEGSYQDSQKTTARFYEALSRGYEENRKFKDPDYEPNPLTAEEAMTLTEEEFAKLFKEAVEAYTGEKVTVETEPVKKQKKTAKSN